MCRLQMLSILEMQITKRFHHYFFSTVDYFIEFSSAWFEKKYTIKLDHSVLFISGKWKLAQSAGTVEYTDCFSAEG